MTTQQTECAFATRVAHLLGVATDHWRKQEYAEAERICREATAIAGEHIGKDSAAYGYCLEDLGIVLTASSKLTEAREVLEEALGVMDKVFGSRSPVVQGIFGRLHDLYY